MIRSIALSQLGAGRVIALHAHTSAATANTRSIICIAAERERGIEDDENGTEGREKGKREVK